MPIGRSARRSSVGLAARQGLATVNGQFSRGERAQLRRLATCVQEAETRALLSELDVEFGRWRAGNCTSGELLDAIHDFHQHRARSLWARYQWMDAATVLERGLSLGLIVEEEIPPKLRARLVPWAPPQQASQPLGEADTGESQLPPQSRRAI